ncbi:hypothetical protein BFW94_14700 [Enterobacter ludwigii]|nr:hypothetical protein BFW94_14700 [Enterobacter ludwigii]
MVNVKSQCFLRGKQSQHGMFTQRMLHQEMILKAAVITTNYFLINMMQGWKLYNILPVMTTLIQ